MVFLISNLRRIRAASSSSATDLVADLRQAAGELRLGVGEAALGVGVGGVDLGPGRQHEPQRAHGRVRVGGHPAAHAARVVGDHAADGREVDARRVGSEAAAVRRQDAVCVAEHRPRPHPHALAAVEHLESRPVVADVDEDAVGLRLAVEAGAGGAEGQRDRALRFEYAIRLGDVQRVARPDHRPRDQPVGARVGGVADEVGDASEHPVGADQRRELRAKRLRGSGGELIGDPVGGGLGSRRERCAAGPERA